MSAVKEKKPKFKLLDGHRAKEAFVLDGIQYWEFADSNMAPCARMFAAMDFYSEFNMRCSREYLIAHTQAVEEQLNGAKGVIDFMKVAQLHLQLKERLEWIFEPDTAYKYASVIFWDENEDPYSYDFKYGREKIERWKKKEPSSFFLSMPVKRLFPLSDISNNDLQDYLKVQMKVSDQHLENIFTILSKNNATKEWYNILMSQKIVGSASTM